jgi:predicted 3-demethylubiquinone-9 3-methyltransferase (glyoxalase superfamily)
MAELIAQARIVPCLWFDAVAEEAARFYTSVFPGSRIGRITRYPESGEGSEIHGREPGSVMTVDFELDGVPFTALDGGPHFKFSEALSLQVMCETQAEIDHYWEALSRGGDPAAQQCGWLKDRYRLSWQIVPRALAEMLSGTDRARAGRAMRAMLGMKKLEIAKLEQALAG